MKPTVYILEGPDGTGKTTLATYLSLRFNAAIWHCTCTPKLVEALADYHNNVLANVQLNLANGQSIILDRFWPSEYVYGVQLFRKGTTYPWTWFQHQIQLLSHRYIFCDNDQSWADLDERGQNDPMHKLDVNDHTAILLEYGKLYLQMQRADQVNTFSYCVQTDGKNLTNFAEMIQ